LNPSHVAGGGIGAILGAVIVGLLKHFGLATVTDVDAAVIGSAALSAGVGAGHAINEYGLAGLASIVWHGHKKPAAAKILPPAPPSV
jgi:hypothetical protein